MARLPGTAKTWVWLAAAAAVAAACWWSVWTLRTYWNPVFFFGLWTSATVIWRILAGDEPMPWRRQAVLMALSTPLWWWFEVVNEWVQNWNYHSPYEYQGLAYFLFASLSFSTVVPALDAWWRLVIRAAGSWRALVAHLPAGRPSWLVHEFVAGIFCQSLILVAPTVFYPLVWIAPFLMLDALVGWRGGVNIVYLLARRQWGLPVVLGLGGIACGFFWEMWNFWAMPKWTYSIPHVHFLQVFEMPVLGYGGYVPFSWAVYQLVRLVLGPIGAGLAEPSGASSDAPGSMLRSSA